MRILDRYLIGNVFVVSVLGVLVLSFFLVVGNVFRELLNLLINENLPLGDFLFFVLLVLPFSLSFTVPWAFLTALLLVFGRLSADNELVAIQSAGVGLTRLCAPVFGLAALLSVGCLWINTDIAPRAKLKMLETLNALAVKNPLALFQPGEVMDRLPDRRIFVGGREGDTLTNVIIFEMDADHTPVRMVVAREGRVTFDSRQAVLHIRLRNVRFEERDVQAPLDVTRIRPGLRLAEGAYSLPLAKFLGTTLRHKSLSAHTLDELRTKIADGADGQLLRARVEFHRRFSLSLACLAFATVGIPLAVTAHRRETTVGFGIALVLAFSYYFFVFLAQEFEAGSAAAPILLMWLPNLLFFLLGGVLFRRLTRR